MQTTFTYGSKRTGISVPRLGAFSSTGTYDANSVFGTLPFSLAGAAILLQAKNIDDIKAAIFNLTKYESDVRKYYDDRVTRTSGGKRDRLRAERADLCNEANAALSLLRSGLATLERAVSSREISKQPNFDPSTGKLVIHDGKPDPQTTGADSGMTKFIIPAVAGLAALFFLKGH